MSEDLSFIPLTSHEVARLNEPPFNLKRCDIKFGSCSMECDSTITICESDPKQLTVIDLHEGNAVKRLKMSAESASMCPGSSIVALRAGQVLQIFDLDRRVKVVSYTAQTPVSYWRWITPKVLAFVTATTVYHWPLDAAATKQPVKVFDRHKTLENGHQIVNYQVSEDGRWCLLSAITAGKQAGTIDGNLQLYSVDKKVSQMLQGHNGLFTTVTPPGRSEPTTVLAFAEKKTDHTGKLFVMEVRSDQSAPPGGVFRVKAQPIPYPAGAPAGDFPTALAVFRRLGMVMLVSKQGYVFLFDPLSGKAMCRVRVAEETVFAVAEHRASGGVLAVTRSGQVLLLGVREEAVVPYVLQQVRDPELALSLATRLHLPGAEALYATQFSSLLQAGDLQGAIRLAVSAPSGALRTAETLQALSGTSVEVLAAAGQPSPLLQYLSLLLQGPHRLTQAETLELAKLTVARGQCPMIAQWLSQDKIVSCEELGDLILREDCGLAMSIYLHVGANDKACACYYICGRYVEMVDHALRTNCRAEYGTLLSQLIDSNPAAAVDLAVRLTCNTTGFPLLDISAAIDAFVEAKQLRECTAFLLEALKFDRAEEGALQTRALEVNFLGGYPQVAEAMLDQGVFSHYNKAYIGGLCARAGLAQWAQRHQVHLLQGQTSALLRQVECVSQMADWLRRRDAFTVAYAEARDATPRDFFLLADLGRQRDAVLAEAAALPMTEGEYSSLCERRLDLIQVLTDQCELSAAGERFEELRVLATLLQQLRDIDEAALPASYKAPEWVDDPIFVPNQPPSA